MVSSEKKSGEGAATPAPEDTHHLIQVRIDKAEKIRAAGLDPYANDFRPEVTAIELHARYGDVDAKVLEQVHTVHTVAGRVITMRQMGKASFFTLRDASAKDIQIYVKLDRVGAATYAMLKLMDLGDIVGVAGTPMKTKTGELSIAADGLRVLTKSVRPLPDKFHGLADVEQRYRHRYVDLIVNPEVRQVFRDRSRIVRGIQRFLDERLFIEVETPVLQELAGGAAAKPFTTHHNTLDTDLYLRIATELHLKRLVVGGLERVYEIGRQFRNEGVSARHNPEFTSIEVYQAYASYEDMMELTESLICKLVEDLRSTTKIAWGERVVDVTKPWRRAPIAQLVAEHLKLDVDLREIDSVEQALAIAVGHTAVPDEPLVICLRELSDDEAERIVPGIKRNRDDAPAEDLVTRAKAAYKAGPADFWRWLGRSIDEAFATEVPGHDRSGAVGDDVTMPAVRNVSADVPTAPAPVRSHNPALDEDTGETTRPRRPVDPMRARRRNIALSLLYAVFDHEVERTLTNPTFITDFPLAVSPLARKRDDDPAVTDRFELIVAGMELANAFSELNDPVDQRARFAAQLRDRARGDDEANELDEDFCQALEIGMPPTAGLGIGIDRLVMVLTNQTSIRDVVLFPQMRPNTAPSRG
ncbi:MAG: lysine--tRNA ligase [Deltaproteobacteria bacterium]|nr:lysine--tRNA ligase [Deltaproteobacteria bacterium]